jgi:ribonucleotide reductase beta subunit family protein with ferritin-like domain
LEGGKKKRRDVSKKKRIKEEASNAMQYNTMQYNTIQNQG